MNACKVKYIVTLSLAALTASCASDYNLNEGAIEYRYSTVEKKTNATLPLNTSITSLACNDTPSTTLATDVYAENGVTVRCIAAQNSSGNLVFNLTCSNGNVLEVDQATAKAVGYKAVVRCPESKIDYHFNARYLTQSEVGDSVFKAGDTITIRLLQGYICDFREGRVLGESAILAKGCDNGVGVTGDSDTRGEIAILANVIEKVEAAGIAYNYDDIKKYGRIVYYNKDVRESGQFLNFSNSPLYGPIEYKGQPLYLGLHILELDNDENNQAKSMIDALAKFGETAYPPSSQVLNILNSVGGALISLDKDDLEFRYQMELDGIKDNYTSDEHSAVLAEGYYAFIRQEDRDMQTKWDKVEIDTRTGHLYRCYEVDEVTALSERTKKWTVEGKKSNCYTYRDNTWLVLKVTKGEDGTRQMVGETFASFQQKSDSVTQANVTEFSESLTGLAQVLQQKSNYKAMLKNVATLQNASKDKLDRTNALDQLTTQICGAIAADTDKSNEYYIDKKQLEGVISRLKSVVPAAKITELSNSKLATVCTVVSKGATLKTNLNITI